ncbi:MAG: Eco57I restriction-modification methylase domain-containing protein, partial [Chloroflexota bacterium]|nr:Eco57I restriction-modification methylase domain-containing protein [Chloroflexota bacterium]MDE2886561.1 Eco57I restriction-modification methylase domain-containing protein [Chloroflexota bacterium]
MALAAMLGTDFPNEARVLLSTLGYRSNRVLDGQSGTVDDFLKRFTAQHPDTRTEQDFRENAMSVHILFQVTDEEIAEGASLQSRMIGGGPFDTGNVKSFLFAAVELKGAGYPRGKYADFTREINRRLAGIPTAVLFRTVDGLLTIAFVHVRPNKRDPNRRVLGSISLIRAINPADPHRAHVDILAELALPERLDWMRLNGKPRNFDGLLAAWLYTLDTEELNNRFYKELFAWFERAVQEAQFPKDGPRTQTAEEHVIRLITRLMFVWFIKEKRLVADDLFIEEQMRRLLKDYDADNGDSYYRAVLQNLFFATLNTEGQREFSNVDNSTHRNFSRYRYKKEMSDPERLLVLFEQTPFINGGLFDCLDSEEATSAGGWRIDCFTDNPRERRGYSIPNRLFFDDAGLVSIFRKYKFTVEENTPAEQEVALDPELLGKVFENLLAAYNPETRENARKQTGSYYTPRAIVDYMVDEALIAALAQHAQPSDGDSVFWQDRLRYLLDYSDAGEVFDEAETDSLIRAIAGLKVLDPAVGSGAFPMGALHKLTLALRRLDPDNRRWEALQKELASERTKGALDVRDPQERNAELLEISDTFEKYRDSDFGRKLYLIQNSIYGVDLQPVACQIAKLRFFISLAIEQQINETQPNHGVKPLPNLETRFVAANTLLGLEKPLQPFLQSEELLKLERDLTANRERHFHAGARGEKLRLRDEDKRLRGLLEAELVKAEMPAPDAHRVAQWDPYDQNATADWFDAEYMFDIRDGFSIVIGNPPYVQLQKDGGKLGNLYKNAGFATFARTGDIYQLFYERGFRLLTANGVLSYITSNSWLKAEYGKATRRYIGDNHTPVRLLETGKDIFEKAIVDTSILVARSGRNTDAPPFFPAVDTDKLLSEDKTFPPSHDLWGQVRLEGDAPWSVLSPVEQSIVGKMRAKGTPLKDWDIVINYGIKTGFNDAFIIDNQTKEALVADDPR